MNIETISLFFAISLLLGLTPGPDNLYVLLQSAKHGKWAGVWILLGLCSGLIVHTLALTFGLSALIAQSSHALNLIKVFGAGYLLYLAWQMAAAPMGDIHRMDVRSVRRSEHYIKGFILNVSNPKVILFFIAFLPQFVHTSAGSLSFELMSLGLLFILATLVSFGSIIVFSRYLRDYMTQQPNIERNMNRIVSLIFTGLAMHLAMHTF